MSNCDSGVKRKGRPYLVWEAAGVEGPDVEHLCWRWEHWGERVGGLSWQSVQSAMSCKGPKNSYTYFHCSL